MPDRPTDNPGPPSGGDPEKTLHDLLAALSNVGDDAAPAEPARGPAAASAAAGEPVEPSPLQELRTALDRLFDLVRAERAEHRAEVAELEAALATANARIRQLEAGEPLDVPAPPPKDFNQLREAAERLRQRTQELFRDAGAVPASPEESAAGEPSAEDEVSDDVAVAASAGAPTVATPPADAPEQAEADDEQPTDAEPADRDEADDEQPSDAEPADRDGAADEHTAEIASIEAFTKPTVLRVFPGPAGPEDDLDLEVESELAIEDDILHPPGDEDDDEDLAAAIAVELPVPQDLPVEDELPADEAAADAPSGAAESAAANAPATADEGHRTSEPVEITPRPARKRRAGLRRRRIDARKLEGVDPATALRAMVTSIDDVWTANVTLDLAIALTDGGTLKVTGGHNRPLSVGWVEPGTPARTTVTATTAQLVPLFGRLELTGAQSAPLIHGPRRDADLLVGWIDRAQRLTPEPL